MVSPSSLSSQMVALNFCLNFFYKFDDSGNSGDSEKTVILVNMVIYVNLVMLVNHVILLNLVFFW